MERPGLRDLVSFDHLVTPRVAAVVFWVAQVANASVWFLVLRSAYKSYDYEEALFSSPPVMEGDVPPDYGMPKETIQWDNIWLCVVLFVLFAILIRVLLDFVLVQFRRLDVERGMLATMSGGQPAAAAAGTAPSRPLSTSTVPPLETQGGSSGAGPYRTPQPPAPPPPG
jgi:hypothetical protein